MLKKSVTTTVSEMVKPIVESEGMRLIDVEFKKERKDWYMRIFIDKNGGVNHKDCENISSQIGEMIEVEEVISYPYILEVSSPGLDRPLKYEDDYRRFKGRLVRIYTSTSVDKKKELVGRIIDIEGNNIIVIEEKDKKDIIKLPFKIIVKGKLEVEF
ncbi:MAG: ribosome maturation factor RimP [Nitrospinae bacterium]|nr:ribosome maturation factor RimP [Nitrospinota bacterium]